MRRFLLTAGALSTALALQAGTAAACGGLVAPNGAIRLARATTLVDWHQGVEHYLTSFSFTGEATTLGWIVPLPAVPTSVEEGGGWTLQRLEREVHPPALTDSFSAQRAAPAAAAAEVLQQVKIQALDVTVLRGSGQAVIDWCARNSFTLDDETRAHVLHYASGSPIFMAARYDVGAARSRGLRGGDGTPLLITMPTPRLWVPLEVLANDDTAVGADLFLLTDEPPRTGEESFFFSSPVGRELSNAPGFVVRQQERIGDGLHRDLSTDRNMGWVRPGSWLTYLTLDAPSAAVTYDMTIDSSNDIRLAGFGARPPVGDGGEVPVRGVAGDVGRTRTVTVVYGSFIVVAVGLLAVRWRRRRQL
ncbi:MAG: DUF2330 domain-containing protein [Candidatus Dormibacteria bacterium]